MVPLRFESDKIDKRIIVADFTVRPPNWRIIKQGKMFIGGLSWQTTPESIREYFSIFGELAEVMVMKDPATRRSRGFGFITFSEPHSVDKVLYVRPGFPGFDRSVSPKIVTGPKIITMVYMEPLPIYLFLTGFNRSLLAF